MYEESSEAKNNTAFATSSGVPKRFNAVCAVIASAAPARTSSGKPIFPQNGVPIGPGLTAFTRMPSPASSSDATRTNDLNAALLALNKLLPPKPTSLVLEEAVY